MYNPEAWGKRAIIAAVLLLILIIGSLIAVSLGYGKTMSPEYHMSKTPEKAEVRKSWSSASLIDQPGLYALEVIECPECKGKGEIQDPTGFWTWFNPIEERWERMYKNNHLVLSASDYQELNYARERLLASAIYKKFLIDLDDGYTNLPIDSAPCIHCEKSGHIRRWVDISAHLRAIADNMLSLGNHIRKVEKTANYASNTAGTLANGGSF